MANHKSAKKRSRQTISKNLRNKMKKSRLRTVVKAIRKAIEAKDKKTAESLFVQAQSYAAKLAKTNTLKDNAASRMTGRLAGQISKL